MYVEVVNALLRMKLRDRFQAFGHLNISLNFLTFHGVCPNVTVIIIINLQVFLSYIECEGPYL